MPRQMRSPIKWFGGKGVLAPWLLQYIPRHHHYVEPFAGGASLLFAKDPKISKLETLNDKNKYLFNLYQVLRDPDLFPLFAEKVNQTLYSRAEYLYARDHYKREPDRIEQARLFYIMTRQLYSGKGGWGHCVSEVSRGMSKSTAAWMTAVDGLPEFHARIRRVQIECVDALYCIDNYDRPFTFFYLDPPYHPSTRQIKGISNRYDWELSLSQHEQLIERLLSLKGKVLLSGYRCSLHDRLEAAGWKRIDKRVVCHSGPTSKGDKCKGEKYKRTESIWLSPNHELNEGKVE